MKVIEGWQGYVVLALFGLSMIVLTLIGSRDKKWKSEAGFMAANRNVPWWLGSISIAVCWIWAPALFVSVQQAYENGVAGVFWFTAPNILSLMIIAPLAIRIRDLLPSGYTQPEWILRRFDRRTHAMFMIPFFWYQLMAVAVQLYAGGNIFSSITGARIEVVMLALLATALTYGLISGMRASILTDFLQYGLILVAGLVVVPWTISAAGGWSAVVAGLGGMDGNKRSIFDPGVAINFGIVTTIGLLSGSLADQQHWQRAFSIEKAGLRRSYLVSGILFGVVPLGISLLGFLAANRSLGITLLPGVDHSMIGVAAVAKLLPAWAVIAFVIMLLGGLTATLDSGLCAASSLYALNCFKYSDAEVNVRRKVSAHETLLVDEQETLRSLDLKVIKRGRVGMIGIGLLGLLVALTVLYVPGFGLQYLWWVFNTIAACVAAPTILSLYWKRTSSNGVFWGVLIAFVLGIPLFVYSNVKNLAWLTIASSVGIVFITVLFAVLMRREAPWLPTREES